MGRKIPGKKHRGVKDPFQQRVKRLAELETKINAPPRDVDEQAVPRSLERLARLKEAVKSGRITKIRKRKRKKKNELICVGAQNNSKPSHPKSRPEKVVPIFQQKPGESNNHFMYRVGKATHAFLNETAFEKKYGVEVTRNRDTGVIEGLNKCQKSVLDELEMPKSKDSTKKKKKESNVPKMTKSQKRKEKLRLKKEEKDLSDNDEFESFKDQIGFGEVVHEPPRLKARPKKVDPSSSNKPGKKSLLLHSLLQKHETGKMSSTKIPAFDRSGKRKNLPVGERRQLEKQQNDVIAAYRRLKAQRSAAVDI